MLAADYRTATVLWILAVVLWRYAYRRFPLKCDRLYWGAAFPFGMDAATPG